MRDRAAQKRHLLQSRHEKITDELATATQMPRILLAKNAGADTFR
jgi:hypothetical protein